MSASVGGVEIETFIEISVVRFVWKIRARIKNLKFSRL